MNLYEYFISLLALFLLNIPVYVALDRYLLKYTRIGIRARISIRVITFFIYWSTAFVLQNFTPFVGVLILLIFIHKKQEDQNTDIRDNHIWQIKPRDIFIVAGISIGARFFILVINIVFVVILDMITKYNVKPQEAVAEFSNAGGIYKLTLFFMMAVFAPIAEEYVFRYYLYHKLLLPKMPAFAAAILSAALFTLLHYNVGGIPSFFTLGLLCTYCFHKKGYYGAVTAHAVFNLIGVLMILLSGA